MQVNKRWRRVVQSQFLQGTIRHAVHTLHSDARRGVGRYIFFVLMQVSIRSHLQTQRRLALKTVTAAFVHVFVHNKACIGFMSLHIVQASGALALHKSLRAPLSKSTKRALFIIVLVHADVSRGVHRMKLVICLAAAAAQCTRAFHALPDSTIIIVNIACNNTVPIARAIQCAGHWRFWLMHGGGAFAQSSTPRGCCHERYAWCALRARERLAWGEYRCQERH